MPDDDLVSKALDRTPRPVRDVFERAREGDLLLSASGLAFYALVSAAPLVLLVLWIVSGLLGDDQVKAFAGALKRVAPSKLGVDQAVTRVADLGTRLGVTAFVGALWPASAYGSGLMRAFDRLSDTEPRSLRGLRGRGLLWITLFPLLVFGGLVAALLGTQVLELQGALRLIGLLIAFATGSGATAATLAVIYRVFPQEAPSWPSIWKAVLPTALAVSVLSVGYTAYIRFGANFEEHYISSGVAAVVLLAVWLYLFNVLVLIGFQVAVEAD